MNDTVILPGSPLPNVYGPLTPSQVFERTAKLLRENFKLFFGIVLVFIGIEIVVGGVLGGSGLWMGRYTAGTAPIMKALFIAPLSLLGAAFIYVFAQIVQGALFLATQATLAGTPVTVGESCRLAAEKAGRLIGISLLVALRSIGYMFLFYFALAIPLAIIAILVHVVGGFQFHSAHAPFLGLGILFALFLLLFVVLYILALFWLIVRYALSIPAALAEGLPVTEAIRRSIHLSRGSKGRLYAVFLVAMGVSIALVAVTLPVQLMALHSAHAHLGVTPAMLMPTNMVLGIFRILVGAVLMAFIGVATALCYFDLRVRKEGFGVGIPAPVLEVPSAPLPPVTNGPIEDLPVS